MKICCSGTKTTVYSDVHRWISGIKVESDKFQ